MPDWAVSRAAEAVDAVFKVDAMDAVSVAFPRPTSSEEAKRILDDARTILNKPHLDRESRASLLGDEFADTI